MTEFLSAVPIVPAREAVTTTTAWYRDELGFEVFVSQPDYGIVGRDEAWLHFCGPAELPSHESGTSFRVGVRGIDELFVASEARGISPLATSVVEEPWGFREFWLRDLDGNHVAFFEPPAGYDPREAAS